MIVRVYDVDLSHKEEYKLVNNIPDNLTYPLIYPKLFSKANSFTKELARQKRTLCKPGHGT